MERVAVRAFDVRVEGRIQMTENDVTATPIAGPALGAMLSDAVIMFHEAVAARRNLSAADHKALGIIERNGPMTASELAKHTGLTAGAITGLVDRLIAAGYVSREHDRADRRRVILSASGEQVSDVLEAFAALSASQSDFADRYTPDEAAAIVDWVTRISHDLAEQTRRLGTRSRSVSPGDPREPDDSREPGEGASRLEVSAQ
jgi:DNA-binding MarR family transcriptional regulator